MIKKKKKRKCVHYGGLQPNITVSLIKQGNLDTNKDVRGKYHVKTPRKRESRQARDDGSRDVITIQGRAGATKGWKRQGSHCLRRLRGTKALPGAWFWTSSLQTWLEDVQSTFMLFQALEFVVLCYGSPSNLSQYLYLIQLEQNLETRVWGLILTIKS